ncbi:MAG TPA: DUF2007 domain-containing protein [Capsulimonadaceae bacterium]
MHKLYSSPVLLKVELIKSLLDDSGIEAVIRNQYLVMARGDVPYTESWPEVWVSDAHTDAARQLLAEFNSEPVSAQPDWICKRCGETIEGQFSDCWKCADPIRE